MKYSEPTNQDLEKNSLLNFNLIWIAKVGVCVCVCGVTFLQTVSRTLIGPLQLPMTTKATATDGQDRPRLLPVGQLFLSVCCLRPDCFFAFLLLFRSLVFFVLSWIFNECFMFRPRGTAVLVVVVLLGTTTSTEHSSVSVNFLLLLHLFFFFFFFSFFNCTNRLAAIKPASVIAS